MLESQNTEFKSSWHDDYLKWICGFANAMGGMIYIGRDDKGKVIGLPDYARLMEDLPNKIRNAMGIICDIQLHEKDKKKFISIKVNPYSVPVSLRGRFYYRSGSTKMELTGVELNEFLIKKAGKTWDDMIEENATIKDIDEKSIAQFIEDSSDKGRLPEIKGLSTFQFLEKLKLTDGKKLKRAAIIMFGKDPMHFYPNIQVKIGRFGIDAADLRFHEIIEGNLVHMYHETQVQLNHKFLIRPITFEGFQRLEHDLYPVAALREMLLNALVHRNYMGATIQMRVYDDRLSIWNEGVLPYGLSLEDLKKEHSSRPRNPLLANACFLGGYIDAWGRGTLKIINACKEAGMPEPEIIEKNGGISMTLFPQTRLNEADDSLVTGSETDDGESVGKASGKRRESVGKTSSKILEACLENPDITIPEMAQKFAVTERSIQRNIQKLQDAGLLKRAGGRKEGHWEVVVD